MTVRRGVRGYRVRYRTASGRPGSRTCWGTQVAAVMADAEAKGCTAIEWRAPLGVDPTGRWFRDPPRSAR